MRTRRVVFVRRRVAIAYECNGCNEVIQADVDAWGLPAARGEHADGLINAHREAGAEKVARIVPCPRCGFVDGAVKRGMIARAVLVPVLGSAAVWVPIWLLLSNRHNRWDSSALMAFGSLIALGSVIGFGLYWLLGWKGARRRVHF